MQPMDFVIKWGLLMNPPIHEVVLIFVKNMDNVQLSGTKFFEIWCNKTYMGVTETTHASCVQILCITLQTWTWIIIWVCVWSFVNLLLFLFLTKWCLALSIKYLTNTLILLILKLHSYAEDIYCWEIICRVFLKMLLFIANYELKFL